MNSTREPNRPASLMLSEDEDSFARRQLDLFTDLIEAVGSAEALWSLDADSLPDELLDESAVDPADLPFVTQVAARVDTVTAIVFDTEHRTIGRRILERVARREPQVLRRRADVDRCAAALVWLVLHANGSGHRRCRAAVAAHPLGDPTLLHSRYCAALIRHRDVLLEIARNRRTFALERTDGRVAHVRVNARQALVAAASKGIYAGETRAVVIVGFGDDAERATYFALSVPEAHELIRMVQHALDSPLPASSMTRFSSGSGRARTRRRRRER